MTKRNEFTPEQKQAYYNGLRSKWAEAKALAATDEIGAVYTQLREMGLGDISRYNVSLIFMQAKELGLDGLPYVDFKTYEHWRASGFQVRKGEKSPVFSLTWIGHKGEDGEEADGKRWPKMTYLFHSSQVEALAV
jgi:hypothetical protein